MHRGFPVAVSQRSRKFLNGNGRKILIYLDEIIHKKNINPFKINYYILLNFFLFSLFYTNIFCTNWEKAFQKKYLGTVTI